MFNVNPRISREGTLYANRGTAADLSRGRHIDTFKWQFYIKLLKLLRR